MHFPVVFHLLGRPVPAHGVLELIAYTAGFQLYLLLRRRGNHPGAAVPFEQNMWLLVGCVFGALAGSKVLAWIESAPDYLAAMRVTPLAILGGKTIVGGLLGGWIGVEFAKRKLAIRQSTGDLYVLPLVLGIAIGRVGCFLTGLPDHTYGIHSHLPWAVDFGDGPRHPTQLYEIAFLLILGVALALRARKPHVNGELFRLFMLAYLCFRFAIEFIKPRYTIPYLNISAIQLASFLGAAWCLWQIASLRRRNEIGEFHHAGPPAVRT